MSSLQIIGGTKKGKKIFVPPAIRPSKNILRKALFDIINIDIKDSIFLDLFAGSGAIGIEALSRGAKLVFFVDNDTSSITTLTKNILACNFNDRATILNQNWEDGIKSFSHQKMRFNYIFLDPPYEFPSIKKLFNILISSNIVTTCGRVFYERSSKKNEIDNMSVKLKEHRYGKSSIVEIII